jgi:hypothetical protein
VQGDVADVVSRDVEAADGVVDRKRQADERTPSHRAVALGCEHAADVAEVANLGVLDDGALVVEDEGQTGYWRMSAR